MASRHKHSVIGVDLGDTSVKMVQLRAGANGTWHLQAVAKGRYSMPAEGDDPAVHGKAVADKMRRLVREGGFTGRMAATVLPRADVFIRPVKLDGKLEPTDNDGVWEQGWFPGPSYTTMYDDEYSGKIRLQVRDDEGDTAIAET